MKKSGNGSVPFVVQMLNMITYLLLCDKIPIFHQNYNNSQKNCLKKEFPPWVLLYMPNVKCTSYLLWETKELLCVSSLSLIILLNYSWEPSDLFCVKSLSLC